MVEKCRIKQFDVTKQISYVIIIFKHGKSDLERIYWEICSNVVNHTGGLLINWGDLALKGCAHMVDFWGRSPDQIKSGYLFFWVPTVNLHQIPTVNLQSGLFAVAVDLSVNLSM